MLYVDGTFNLVESDLILTVILGKINKVVIPVLYIIHSNREYNTYLLIFEAVKALLELNHFEMKVTVIFTDFESALRK